MGSLSVSTHRGLVQWQELLLVVSLLTFWSPPTTATMDVLSTFATEGKDVVLRIRNKPPGVVVIVWYKGKGMYHNNTIAFCVMTPCFHVCGPKSNGQQMITDDGSLLFKNVTRKDEEMYTAVAHLPDSKTEIASGELIVYEEENWGELIQLFKKIRRCKEEGQDNCPP